MIYNVYVFFSVFVVAFFLSLVVNLADNGDNASSSLPRHPRNYGLLRRLLHMELQDTIYMYNLSYHVTEEAEDSMPCLETNTAPSVNICTYEPRKDKFVSAMLNNEGVWEPEITKLFQAALRFYPQAVVVDMGANVGFYTLLAAKMGHRVISVEPVRSSVVRLHRGAQMSDVTDRVHMLLNAVSNQHEYVTFKYSKDNVGGTSVRAINVGTAERLAERDSDAVATTVTTDDLLNVMNVTQAILKIDIGKLRECVFTESLDFLICRGLCCSGAETFVENFVI